jgi:hypothetical protein
MSAEKSEEELKPYKCQYEGCGKRFTKSSNLTQHLRIHSGKLVIWFCSLMGLFFVFILGEKPFQCDLCGRSFRQSGNLTKHLKSHENAHLRWNRSTSEKPFKCPHEGCDKSFTAKSSLQNHLRAHSEEILQIFPQSEAFQSEKAVIKPPLPAIKVQKERIPVMRFQCIHPNCKKNFAEESELRAHLVAYNPGMAAENQFLRESVFKLTGYIESMKQRGTNAVVSCFSLLLLDLFFKNSLPVCSFLGRERYPMGGRH